MHSCALFFYNCFAMSPCHYILCLCCTFCVLHSFHILLFPMYTFSCCTLFMLNFFYTTLFSCWNFFTLHSFYVALFLFFVLHSFCVALPSCYILFMFLFFRVAHFSCCTFFLLEPFDVTLSLCCSFPVLHYFYDTLLCVNFFRESLPEKNFRGIASFAKAVYFFLNIFTYILGKNDLNLQIKNRTKKKNLLN